MNSRLHTRLDKLEQQAPSVIDRIRARQAEVEEIRADLQPSVEGVLAVARYCGLPGDREQLEMDMIETVVLIEHFLGDAERTQEKMLDAIRRADQRLHFEWYDRELSADEREADDKLAVRVREDMQAGIPAERSEAARLIREEAYATPRVRKQSGFITAYLAGSLNLGGMQ